MKSTVETLGPTRVKIAVEVPFTELQPSIDTSLKRLAGQVRIPGFRPGKAPARLIEQRIGRAAILEEAVNETVPRVYSEAIRENNVQALGQPDVEVTKLEDGQTLEFTAEVDVRPDFTLPEYRKLPVTVDAAEVTDTQVDEQLDALRERFVTLHDVERPVATGDYVLLDLKAEIGGEEVEGGSATGLSYEVGGDDLIDGLDDALVGLEKDGTATFGTELRAGERAGEQADVTVTVHSVKDRELPDADDEFAQMASEFDTLDELKSDLRERLGRVSVMTQGAQARELLLDKLLDETEIPLPESAVKAEVDWREHDVVHQLNHDDAAFARYLETQGTTREDFEADLRKTAERAVHSQFVLDAIADAESVSVSDDELSAYLIRQAQRYNMSPQDFANQLVQNGTLPAVVAEVRRAKAMEAVMKAAVVTDSNGAAVDLSVLDEPIEESATDTDENTDAEEQPTPAAP